MEKFCKILYADPCTFEKRALLAGKSLEKIQAILTKKKADLSIFTFHVI